MDKAETKFANTAKKMDAALLRLLETTDFEDISVAGECRHSSSCHAAFLPGIGLSATTSAMILAACSAAVPS